MYNVTINQSPQVERRSASQKARPLMEDDIQICPECGHPNPPAADVCQNCDAPLHSDTTLTVAAHAKGLTRAETGKAGEVEQDVLYFYVAGAKQSDALIHRGQSSAVLGRRSDETAADDNLIDLNRFQAYSLGVSRRHARINYTESGYTIEDLDSSNGTWLNGNRLEPNQPQVLHRGDHIQLGELMMFVYYFHASAE